VIGVGHSIFNPHCRVNVGLMLARFGGGGHRGAGSCTVSAEEADPCLASVLETLARNEPNE
jgi:nanoRNase/pAp phosphatase (c-di-AMP/oligoRNAs hydrolase)